MVFFRILAWHRPAEAGAHRVDENEVGVVEQRILVIHKAERWRWQAAVFLQENPARPQDTQMQPNGGGTRAAVERESDGTFASVGRTRTQAGIGHKEKSSVRFVFLILHQQRAGGRPVVDLDAIDDDGIGGLRELVLWLLFVGLRLLLFGFLFFGLLFLRFFLSVRPSWFLPCRAPLSFSQPPRAWPGRIFFS